MHQIKTAYNLITYSPYLATITTIFKHSTEYLDDIITISANLLSLII